MAGYIVLAIAFLLPLSFAILLIKIAMKDGVKKAFQIGFSTIFAIGSAWIAAPHLASWLNGRITKLSLSENDVITFGLILLVILLFADLIGLLYKKIQPKIAISLTYLVNLSAWIFLSKYFGWVDEVINEATVFFFLCNVVLVCAALILNRPPDDYKKSLFYWPLNVWSVATIVVLLTFAHWHNSGLITEVGINVNRQVSDLWKLRQESLQKMLKKQIADLETRYRNAVSSAEAAGSIEDCTAADSILLEIDKKSLQLQEVQRESEPLKPVADVIDSGSQIVSNTKNMINKDGFVIGPIKKIWYGAVGQPVSKPMPLTKEWLSQPAALQKGEVIETVAVPDNSTVYFESNKAFYIVEKSGINDDGSEQLTKIKMPVGESRRFFKWGGTVKIEGMFDGTSITIKY